MRQPAPHATLVRRGLPLRWRIAVLTALATLLLGLVGSATAYLVARGALHGDLRSSLERDVMRVVDAYQRAESARAELVAGPTGRIGVHLYEPGGGLIVSTGFASTPVDPNAPRSAPERALLPADLVEEVWSAASEMPVTRRLELDGRSVETALAPFEFGVVAVLADTGYIARTLAQLARALAVAALVLAALAALLGYLVAAVAIRPIALLARYAATRGPGRLEPIPYRGPRDEVGLLARVLNELIARLKGALDAQRSFLAETSHELRTPLTSLQGFLARADRNATPEVQRDLDDARRIATTLSRLVEDLLQLSRGQLVREVDPHIVDPVADVLRPVAEEFPGVRVAASGGESLTLVGDPERLRQLVRNLTANAVRAAGPDGVELRARLDGNGDVIVEVRDEGPGIPPELQERLFEKFHKGAGGGAGLGLAIARQIAEHHGGGVEVASRPGETVFRVRLPGMDEVEEG